MEQGKAINPSLKVVARAHSDDETAHLRRLGADSIIMGEREIAHGMIEAAFPGTDKIPAPPPGAAVP